MAYTYKDDMRDTVVRDADQAFVWPDKEVDWAEYQAWLAEGNTPAPPPSPPPAPEPVPITEKLEAMGIDVNELRALLNSTTTV
jgi:hypothetical protein